METETFLVWKWALDDEDALISIKQTDVAMVIKHTKNTLLKASILCVYVILMCFFQLT